MTSTRRLIRDRVFPAHYGWEMRFPVDPETVKVITLKGGEILPWWKDAIEGVFNLIMLMVFVLIAARIDPIFGVLWALISITAFTFTRRMSFRLFVRPPEVRTEAYVKSQEFARFWKPDGQAND